jgi:hypothetical protein
MADSIVAQMTKMVFSLSDKKIQLGTWPSHKDSVYSTQGEQNAFLRFWKTYKDTLKPAIKLVVKGCTANITVPERCICVEKKGNAVFTPKATRQVAGPKQVVTLTEDSETYLIDGTDYLDHVLILFREKADGAGPDATIESAQAVTKAIKKAVFADMQATDPDSFAGTITKVITDFFDDSISEATIGKVTQNIDILLSGSGIRHTIEKRLQAPSGFITEMLAFRSGETTDSQIECTVCFVDPFKLDHAEIGEIEEAEPIGKPTGSSTASDESDDEPEKDEDDKPTTDDSKADDE